MDYLDSITTKAIAAYPYRSMDCDEYRALLGLAEVRS